MAGVRAIQKEKTRRALIDAAFNQLSAEKSFSNLSLREVARVSVETFFEFITHSTNVFRLLLRESSGTSQAFRTAAAREIKHFVDELAEYIAKKNHYSQYVSYVQAEGMVTIVFTAGSNALDMTKAEQDLLKERVILQLRMLAKGGDFAAHKEKMMRK